MPKKPTKFQNSVVDSPAAGLKEASLRIETILRKGGDTLNLSKLRLTELPRSIIQIKKLKALNLSSNSLEIIPKEIAQLKHLNKLTLYNNNISSLPNWIGRLRQLEEIHLSYNKIKNLPESFIKLQKLKILLIASNKFTNVPKSLRVLNGLRELYIWGNHIKVVPKWISELSQLRHLNISRNPIKKLPSTIGRLTYLEKLFSWDCKLEDLPESLLNAPKLRWLALHNNEQLGIPVEILGPDFRTISDNEQRPTAPRYILDYFFSTRGAAGQALREVKLIVVGRGGAGKTTLIKRLKGESYNPMEGETHGINISPLSLECIDGPVQARVWDFGGQHVLHAMHEFFLTTRSLYVLVLGERDDMAERDAAYWLQIIRSYAGSAPVIVVLNKSNGRAREMDRRTMEDRYGPILAWVPTECSEPDLEKSGIAALRLALTEATGQMNQVRARFPAKWIRIKERLEDMAEPYMDFAMYSQICNELGEINPAAQERLAMDLNELGIALNYSNDTRLHDTTVLRPNWLADGIYAILRANDSRHPAPIASDGIVTAESLGGIYQAAEALKMLKAADYPQEKWSFLLRLMGRFQLSFPLDDQGKRQLVPALLPVEEPHCAIEPTDENRVRLRYEFSVVPAPLIPRLLVRMFGLIQGSLQWRRGAMFSYGSATAKIWSTQDERWVYATIAAPIDKEAAKKDLTNILRETLRGLFSEYKNLSVVEQIEWNGSWVPRTTLEQIGAIQGDEGDEIFEEEGEL